MPIWSWILITHSYSKKYWDVAYCTTMAIHHHFQWFDNFNQRCRNTSLNNWKYAAYRSLHFNFLCLQSTVQKLPHSTTYLHLQFFVCVCVILSVNYLNQKHPKDKNKSFEITALFKPRNWSKNSCNGKKEQILSQKTYLIILNWCKSWKNTSRNLNYQKI